MWRRRDQLKDWLPWWLPMDDREQVILTKTGGLLRVAAIEPPDCESSSPEALVEHHERIARVIEGYGDGWSFWFDQWRGEAQGYLDEDDFGGCLAAQVVDASQRRVFSGRAGNRFVGKNSAFVAAHYLPSRKQAVIGWAMDETGSVARRHMEYFQEHSGALFDQIGQTMTGVDVLGGETLASYLKASVTYRPKRTHFPAEVIADAFAGRVWDLGDRVTIDDLHVTTVEVRDLGAPSPLTVEALHELPFPARWVTTMHGLSLEHRRKHVDDVGKRWLMKQKGAGAYAVGVISKGRKQGEVDQEAKNSLDELKHLKGKLAKTPFGLATMNIHVWADRREVADDRAQEVIARISKRDGFDARIATNNNAFALLADMPGAVGRDVSNPRQTREDINTISKLAPLTGVSSGWRQDWRFGGQALLAGLTRRATPFYWALNTPGSDFAHCCVVGRSGGGKSTLLALMAAQFLRYRNATVTHFDRRRSFLPTCLALGGEWIELGGGGRGVQPLRMIHLLEERAWAHGWVLHALRLQGMPTSPQTDEAISTALAHVATKPLDERTLSMLQACLGGDKRARQALGAYIAGGSYGTQFDGVVRSYGTSRVVGIETLGVDGLGPLAPLLMAAVFRAVQRDRLGGTHPKLLFADEWGILLRDDLFADEISSFALEARKLNTALVLATQSLAHFNGEKAEAIWNQLGNKVFLPHAEAMRDDSFKEYQSKGLREEHVRLLAQAQSKAEYLLRTEDVTRLVNLRLEGDALAICGAIGPAHQERALALLADGIEPGAEFTRAWLSEPTTAWIARQEQERLAA